MNHNYFLIDIEGEKNVGVIDINDIDINVVNINVIKYIITLKLIIALAAYYDCDVNILSIEFDKMEYNPTINIIVAVEDIDNENQNDEPYITKEVKLIKTMVH